MIRYRRFWWLPGCILLWWGTAAGQPARPLALYTEDLPPYNLVENDRVTGLSSEILAVALRRVQVAFTMRLVSWKRAYHEALSDPNSCVYSTVKSAEREKLFQWVGPIAHDSLAVFVLPDSKIQARTLAELDGYRTVITQGDYAEPKLRENGIVIVPTPPAEKQMEMLLAGRIDFWVANRGQAQIEAKRSGLQLRELFAYEDFDLYLACNPGVSNELIEHMNAAVKQVWESGEAARIAAKFTAGPM